MSIKVNNLLSGELETLLAQSTESICRIETRRFDELAGPYSRSLVLYGAGGLGRKTLHGLRKIGIEPLAFTDNNPNLYGQQVDGLEVLSPSLTSKKFGENALFIITVYTDSAPGGIEPIVQKLSELGSKNIISFVPLYWKYPDLFLPHYAYDLPHKVIDAAAAIKKVALLFNDPVSQSEFLGQIHWRLNPEIAPIPAQADHEIYFPPELISLNENEFFIDCGAYTGDTVRCFLKQSHGKFRKIMTIEPDPANYRKLNELIDSLPEEIAVRIKSRDLAVGDRSDVLHFNARGTASSLRSDSGGILVQSEPLDSLLAGEIPTYIKMDIEGAELEALKGATNSIRKHLPILAISVYHCQDHIWNIPLTLHAISDQYHFYLRRYSPRVLDELVLYAIPEYRKLD
jgi:FkbM family methyltransferase